MDNLIINIATKNGTGSLSANQLLTKILFRAGWATGAFNFFPSNIAGLPCLYSLRLNGKGWTAFSEKAHILLSLNPASLPDDLKALDENGLLISDEKNKIASFLTKAPNTPSASKTSATQNAEEAQGLLKAENQDPSFKTSATQNTPPIVSKTPETKQGILRPPHPTQKAFVERSHNRYLQLQPSPPGLCFKAKHLSLPLTQSLNKIEGLRPKTKPLFKNIIYVGLFCEWLQVEPNLVKQTLGDFFAQSQESEMFKKNLQACLIGRELARGFDFPFTLPGKTLNQQALLAPSRLPGVRASAGGHSIDTKQGAKTPPSAFATQNPLQTQPKGSKMADPTPETQTAGDHPAQKEDLLSKKPPAGEDSSLSNYQTQLAGKKPLAGEDSAHKNQPLLIDGNTALALGALSAGCQFVSWYPITPASSLAESFEYFANQLQKDKKGRKKFAVLQAEDEIGGICQAIGAGWAGLRAMTVTSGPGLSLMSEAAGLSYFAEIPLVLCNVQRAGPSTGLPTRTRQGDLLSACFLSHGDSKHVVLLPGTPKEAFDLAQKAFDLAEELNTLIIVLSDLDLAMNLKVSWPFAVQSKPLQRGRILKAKDLKKKGLFQPYSDETGDGVSYRSLPGGVQGQNNNVADFTRGSGHNTKGEYSERPEDCAGKLEKLEQKWQTAKKLMPQPLICQTQGARQAFVTFGPNQPAICEFISELSKQSVLVDFMRVLAFPFPASVGGFLKQYEEIFVVEQNRDGQLRQLLCAEFPHSAQKMKSILQYDGRPLSIETLQKGFALQSSAKKL